jgi:hypothetical protein
MASGRERGADHFRQIDFAGGSDERNNAGVEISVIDHGVFQIAGRMQYIE